MDRQNLIEIKKGQTGTGLLIENDGFISPDCGNNKKLFEAINAQNATDGEFHCPYPFVVDAVFQKFGIENANGRIYPENILKREVESYLQKIKEKRAMGELNHPSESIIDLSRVAINIVEFHWEGHTLIGKLEVITSPGFRKYGIISCQGDQTANLLLQGYKIGVSSRGLGTVTNKMGVLYVADDYEIVCWDVVSDPSTPGAFISVGGEGELQQYVEEKQSDKDILDERFDRAGEILENF
jgi:hypothetical protein